MAGRSLRSSIAPRDHLTGVAFRMAPGRCAVPLASRIGDVAAVGARRCPPKAPKEVGLRDLGARGPPVPARELAAHSEDRDKIWVPSYLDGYSGRWCSSF